MIAGPGVVAFVGAVTTNQSLVVGGFGVYLAEIGLACAGMVGYMIRETWNMYVNEKY